MTVKRPPRPVVAIRDRSYTLAPQRGLLPSCPAKLAHPSAALPTQARDERARGRRGTVSTKRGPSLEDPLLVGTASPDHVVGGSDAESSV